MLRESLEAVVALSGRRTVFCLREFQPPLPLSTRCLIPKTYGVGPQSP